MTDLSLDLIGIAEGTDKHSLYTGYLDHYERMFRPLQHEPIDIIEIGVFKGGSLRTWRRFFSKARIIGVDINPACLQYAGNDVIVEIGSQNDAAFLESLRSKYQPTIVIDDGSHRALDIKFTFERLFPALLPGGCYVIEDVEVHFGPEAERFRDGASLSLPALLSGLQARLLCATHAPSPDWEVVWRVAAAVARVETIRGAAAFWKREHTTLTGQQIDQIEGFAMASRQPVALRALSKILDARGDSGRAERVARYAVECGPREWISHARLAEILEHAGDAPGAAAALEAAIALAGNARAAAGLPERLRGLLAAKG